MARAYDHIAGALAAMSDTGLAERFAAHVRTLKAATYLGEEALRVHREAVYGEMFEEAGRALGQTGAGGALAAVRRVWREDLAPQLGDVEAVLAATVGDAAVRRRVAGAILDFAAAAGAAIEAGSLAQARINRLLGRQQPQRRFDSRDLDQHNHLQDTQPRRVPYLPDELHGAFGLDILVSSQGLKVQASGAHPLSPIRRPSRPDSAQLRTQSPSQEANP
jgi:hypothetical protein